jgi:hypothetical protein
VPIVMPSDLLVVQHAAPQDDASPLELQEE